MITKIIATTFSFYFLTLFQSSFLVHFFPIFLNLVLITVILINFLEDEKSNFGILAGILGGFFLDVFSENYIGFNIVILFLICIFIKFVLKSYLQPTFKLRLPKPSF